MQRNELELYFLVKDDKYDLQFFQKPLNLMKDLRRYTVACKFDSLNNFSLFKIMNDLVNPVLTYKPSYGVFDNSELVPLMKVHHQGEPKQVEFQLLC